MTGRARLRWLLAAHTISSTGNAATAIALPLYVLATTGSAVLVGVVATAAVVPVVVGGLFGGVLVDRFGYRRTSVVADAVGAVTILAVPVLHVTTGLPFWALVLLVVATNLLDTPGQAARHALLPELAREARVPLESATASMDAAERASRLLGAPAAGAAVAVFGAPAVLVADAVTFVAAAALVALALPASTRAARARAAGAAAAVRSYLGELREGLGFVRTDRLLLAVVGMVTVTNALDAAWSSVVLPVYATDRLGGGTAFGLLVGVFGAGAVLGALLFARVAGRFSRRAVFAGCFLVAGAPRLVVMAADPGLTVLLLTLGLAGLAAGAINPVLGAAQLERVPADLRARVAGVVGAGAWAGMPAGTLVAGVWLEHGSMTALLLALAGVYLAVTLLPVLSPTWRELDRFRDPAGGGTRRGTDLTTGGPGREGR
ncbi:MFS transporter [Kineococcus gynurae]|uniref:MFS transporter n=1 Tax=Kineococcus gynurae TaxID=452979 RepID=A0ABV5LVY6_9ACTN